MLISSVGAVAGRGAGVRWWRLSRADWPPLTSGFVPLLIPEWIFKSFSVVSIVAVPMAAWHMFLHYFSPLPGLESFKRHARATVTPAHSLMWYLIKSYYLVISLIKTLHAGLWIMCLSLWHWHENHVSVFSDVIGSSVWDQITEHFAVIQRSLFACVCSHMHLNLEIFWCLLKCPCLIPSFCQY